MNGEPSDSSKRQRDEEDPTPLPSAKVVIEEAPETNDRVFSPVLSDYDKAKFALENGVTNVRVIIHPSTGSGGFPTISPETQRDIFVGILHDSDVISVTRNGRLLLITSSLETITKLSSYDLKICGIPASFRVIEESMVSKFIIRGISTNISLSEIANGLNEENIKFTQIVRFRKKGSDSPIPVVLVKELGSSSRSEVFLWKFRYRAHPYVETPRICFRCLEFGHFQSNCKRPPRCKLCGDLHDAKVKCTREARCFRCDSKDHSSTDSSCEHFQNEQRILDTASSLKIPFLKAKDLVSSQNNNSRSPAWGQRDFPALPSQPAPVPVNLPNPTLDNLVTEVKNFSAQNLKLAEEVSNLRKEISTLSQAVLEVPDLRRTVFDLHEKHRVFLREVCNFRKEYSKFVDLTSSIIKKASGFDPSDKEAINEARAATYNQEDMFVLNTGYLEEFPPDHEMNMQA